MRIEVELIHHQRLIFVAFVNPVESYVRFLSCFPGGHAENASRTSVESTIAPVQAGRPKPVPPNNRPNS